MKEEWTSARSSRYGVNESDGTGLCPPISERGVMGHTYLWPARAAEKHRLLCAPEPTLLAAGTARLAVGRSRGGRTTAGASTGTSPAASGKTAASAKAAKTSSTEW